MTQQQVHVLFVLMNICLFQWAPIFVESAVSSGEDHSLKEKEKRNAFWLECDLIYWPCRMSAPKPFKVLWAEL